MTLGEAHIKRSETGPASAGHHDAAQIEALGVRCRRVSPASRHAFFGYYDKSPWSPNGRRLLMAVSDFGGRMPGPDDRLTLGWVDSEADDPGGTFEAFSKTTAWCWQQGCMLQWWPGRPGWVLFNTHDGSGLRAVGLCLSTGRSVVFNRPIYAVDPHGRFALSLSFSRLASRRHGYGYAGVADVFADDPAPAEDGVWRLDLETGRCNLIWSVADATALAGVDVQRERQHWLNHAQINPDGSRFGLIHRHEDREGQRVDRFLTVGVDGDNPRRRCDEGYFSHYDWQDPETILAYARAGGRSGYFLFSDASGSATPFAVDLFEGDGHCSFSPDRRWVLTDTYPDESTQRRSLSLCDAAGLRRIDLAQVPDSGLGGALRCDLHPRWDRGGKAVCFDAFVGAKRGVYTLDLPSLESVGKAERADHRAEVRA